MRAPHATTKADRGGQVGLPDPSRARTAWSDHIGRDRWIGVGGTGKGRERVARSGTSSAQESQVMAGAWRYCFRSSLTRRSGWIGMPKRSRRSDREAGFGIADRN
jgi:hypothetical protein